MFDSATLTISGNVVANPVITGVASNPDRVGFRVVSNWRRRNPVTREWEQAGEYGINVVCWRKLARGVANSVRRGDPVLVTGRLVERQFEGKDGQMRWYTEVIADFVGLDLSQGINGPFTRFTRLDRLNGQDPDAPGEEAGNDTDEIAGADVAVQGELGASGGGVDAFGPALDAFDGSPDLIGQRSEADLVAAPF